MTGPEHYTEAERLIAIESDLSPSRPEAALTLAAAQVHATLALVAAHAMSLPIGGMPDEPGLGQEEFDDWYAAVNGLPAEARHPAESYLGELAHLRDLLTAVNRAANEDKLSAAFNDILIDHYSDSRIVDEQAGGIPMKTRDEYAAEAEILLGYAAGTSTNYDETNPAAALLFAQAQVFATLATVAPVVENAELVALRRAVAELLHDADTSSHDQAHEVLARFHEGLPDTAHGEPVLDLLAEEHAAYHADGEPTATELYEMDQDAEFAHDAAADEQDAEGDR